jgi:hypothetical protein|tara:strand:+ start:482 stop:622 length:141 start_codon:yes stop_codon:yes gene_type:complete
MKVKMLKALALTALVLAPAIAKEVPVDKHGDRDLKVERLTLERKIQ